MVMETCPYIYVSFFFFDSEIVCFFRKGSNNFEAP